jgi:uncharacterized protein
MTLNRRRQSTFLPKGSFAHRAGYTLLPFRFEEFPPGRVILVNEVGEHLVISEDEFEAFVGGALTVASPLYLDLKGKHLLYDDDVRTPQQLLSVKYRTKKEHLAGFVKLHIFVVSLRCEHSCHYCQVSRVSTDRSAYDMTSSTADKALDLVFATPAQDLKIEFQGGEPLLNFDLVKHIVAGAKRRALTSGKNVEFVVTTNLAVVTDEIMEYCREHRIWISTSLDGPAHIHNANRPRPGRNSYELTVQGIKRARRFLGHDGVSALMTATKLSLNHPNDIVDEYVAQGFSSIFLRSLSPFGFARRSAKTVAYPIEDFLEFYAAALRRIIEWNRNGVLLIESFAQNILARILTPFSTGYVDLQSPAGAGTSVAVYNYDGDVYASDEARMLAEMNDKRFRLGNVHRDGYGEIFGSEVVGELISSTNIESIPVCSDCAFQPYCGSDPVLHYATQGDLAGYIPGSDFHKKHHFAFKHLLGLYHSDKEIRRIFHRWVLPPDSRTSSFELSDPTLS